MAYCILKGQIKVTFLSYLSCESLINVAFRKSPIFYVLDFEKRKAKLLQVAYHKLCVLCLRLYCVPNKMVYVCFKFNLIINELSLTQFYEAFV